MKLVIVWRVWEHHEFVHVRDEGFLYQLSRFFFLIVGANGSVFPILRRKTIFSVFFFCRFIFVSLCYRPLERELSASTSHYTIAIGLQGSRYVVIFFFGGHLVLTVPVFLF